jgi:hypothetical protein
LGESETPFFGIPKKEKERKKAEESAILRSADAGLGGRMWSLSTSPSS